MSYITNNTGFNGDTGSLGRYSFLSGKNDLYGHLYHKIDMSSSEMDDEPSQAAPGSSMIAQAKAAGYKDMFRNIQAMRDSAYKKERKEGEISSEFSGLRPGGLGDGFWFG